MSLIKCPECGKDVSDKAVFCPNCGCPIKSYTKEVLCCPKCGSSNLSSEKKGFSGKKAVAGALLTGGIGLLAGTIGSNDTMITCLKCGHRFKAGQGIIRQVDRDNKPIIDDKKIRNIIAGKGRIYAIKYCHENLGMSFEWAKDHVDHIIRKDQGLKPLSAAERRDNDSVGCVAVAIIAILMIGAFVVAIVVH
jgi:hypothetical protein